MSDSFPSRISYAEACAIIDREAQAHRMASEQVTLSRAHGRVLANDIVATLAQPPFDNSAMDGFALRHADLAGDGETGLALVGEQFAGLALDMTLAPGQCARITTGAALPAGSDTVVMKENTRIEGDRVIVLKAPALRQHVRRQGEDSAAGDGLLRAGDVLTPARVALAASQGLPSLQVARRPTVAVFATGDELVEPGLPLRPGQIYNSNREQLMGLLREAGLEPVAWPTLPDEPERLASMLRDAAQSFDLVVTCGAVSAGEKDHLPELLRREGRILFWKARLKPGMPVLFAEGGTLGSALLLCLPGNPVSVLATWLALGRRLVDGLQGREPRTTWHARLQTPWRKTHDRFEFLRGCLSTDQDGSLSVLPNPADGSHRMRAAADSNALILLPEGARDYAQGSVVDVLAY